MKNSSRDQAKPEFKQTSFLPDAEFEVITGSWRLSAVIFTLKGLGWPVDSSDIAAPSKDCPSILISHYFLSDKIITDVLGGAI